MNVSRFTDFINIQFGVMSGDIITGLIAIDLVC